LTSKKEERQKTVKRATYYSRREELPKLDNTITLYPPSEITRIVQYLRNEADVPLTRLAEISRLNIGTVSNCYRGKMTFVTSIDIMWKFKNMIDLYSNRSNEKYQFQLPSTVTLINPRRIKHVMELYNVKTRDINEYLDKSTMNASTIASARRKNAWTFNSLLAFSAAFDYHTGLISKTDWISKDNDFSKIVISPLTKKLRSKNDRYEEYLRGNLSSVQKKA